MSTFATSSSGEGDSELADFVRDNVRGYIQPPFRLRNQLGISLSHDPRESFAGSARLAFLRSCFVGRQPLGHAVDLGGNAGYLTLSLIDEGLLSSVEVLDLNEDALSYGRACAKLMGSGDRAVFTRGGVTIDDVENLPHGDIVFCSNLIHHAGSTYDVEQVRSLGWPTYAARFLQALRSKYSVGVIGMAYKGKKPLNWSIEQWRKPAAFRSILGKAGWNIERSANVAVLADAFASGDDASFERAIRQTWISTMEPAMRRQEARCSKRAKHDKLAKYYVYVAS